MVSGGNFFENDGYKKALGRVEALADSGSFSQLGAYVSDSNVVTGFCRVDSRACYVYSQYGPVNAAHAKKIADVYDMAVAAGVPVVGMLDSEGLVISEGMETLSAYGRIFKTMADASGVIPQYAVVMGSLMGVATVVSGLSDFTFALKSGKIFIQSPNTVEGGKSVGLDKLPTAAYHGTRGAVDFVFDDENALMEGVKSFLGFMPQNNLDESPVTLPDEESGPVNLDGIDTAALDVYKVIGALADGGFYMETAKNMGKDTAVCFARVDGVPVCFAANNGGMSVCGIKKLVKAIAFCNAFNIPITALSNISAFAAGLDDQKDMISAASSLAYAWANATVPKINVVLKNANGAPYMLFNSKFIGADVVYAWPGANASLFEPEAAKAVLHEDFPALDDALKAGYIDGVIEPGDTKKVISAAIDALFTKRVFKHPKKHGTMCF